jgi:hypothetical protein
MPEGPDFLCIGAPKAGTGWLYDQLSWHPQAWVPMKELHVFDKPHAEPRKAIIKQLGALKEQGLEKYNAQRLAKRRPAMGGRDVAFLERYAAKTNALDFDWYRSLFSGKGSSVSGELTPAYCGLPQRMVDQIALQMPTLRIVLLIRDPIARAWSHLQMRKRLVDQRGPGLSLDDLGAVRSYLDRPAFRWRSRPTEIIRRWTRAFPESQFHYEFFDDIVRSPQAVRRSVMEFLGLDPALGTSELPAEFNRKSSRTKYQLTPELKALLLELFGDEVERCARELQGPALEWQKLYAAA